MPYPRVILIAALAMPGVQAQPFVQALTQNATLTVELTTQAVTARLVPGTAAAQSSSYLFIGGDRTPDSFGRGLLAQYGFDSTTAFQMPGLIPQALAVTPDSARLYFIAALAIQVWDIASRRIVATIPIEPGKGKGVLSPDGRKLYVTIGDHPSVIDTVTNAIIGYFDDPNAVGIAISPDGARAYVGNTFDDFSAPGLICNVPNAVLVQVFDTATRKSIKDIRLGGSSCAESLALSPNGKALYVGDGHTFLLRVVDTVTLTQVDPIQMPAPANDLAISPDGSQVIAATSAGLVIIDTATKKVVKTINVGAPVFNVLAMWGIPEPKAVVNTASSGRSVSPGSVVSIYGTDLSHGLQSAASLPLPGKLLETSVFVNNVPAPLFFVSSEQINFQIPHEVAPGPAAVRIERKTIPSRNLQLTVDDASPGIFTLNQQGTGAGLIVHGETFGLVSQTAPAKPEEFLVIYASGLGKLQQSIPSGVAAPQPNPTVITPEVSVGGVPAAVLYAGAAPGFVGLYQVNIQLGPDVPKGANVPVVLTVGAAKSNAVEIAIQ